MIELYRIPVNCRIEAHTPAYSPPPAPCQIDPSHAVLREVQQTQAALVATLRDLQQTMYQTGQQGHDLLVRLAEPHQALDAAIRAAAAPHLEPPKSTRQAVAGFLATWTSPVLQILIGAAILVVGALTMEMALIAMGSTYVVLGIGILITLIASHNAPHPLDALKHYFERKHTPVDKPEITTQVLLD